MKKNIVSKLAVALTIAAVSMGGMMNDAEAKRLGGGGSAGMQRSTPSSPAAPAGNSASMAQKQAAPAQQAAPAAGAATQQAAAASNKSRWLGPLAGLAAGLGLGWLLAGSGLGGMIGSMLMVGLLVLAAVMIFKFLRRSSATSAKSSQGMAYAGPGPMNAPATDTSASAPASSYAGSSGRVEAPAIGSGLGLQRETSSLTSGSTSAAASRIPADFDVQGFLDVAREQYLRLQKANDAGRVAELAEFLTPELLADVRGDIGLGAPTEILGLTPSLLEVATEGSLHIASVRFSGTSREAGITESFDEVWHIVKPTNGSDGWRVAGIQPMQ